MTELIRSVIIPAAGQGTRLLPLTKAVPKEMLPVYDRPILQFALDEAVAAGARRIVIVINAQKACIRDYVSSGLGQVVQFRKAGKHDLATALSLVGVPSDIDVTFVVQDRPLGLGHAVLCAAPVLEPGPVGVILPDDVILGRPCLEEMAAGYTRGHMVAAMDVPPSETSKYGIFAVEGPMQGKVVRVRGMVEKPAQGTAPSTLAAVGRYILSPGIMATLASTAPGAGGEIQLTDAIAKEAAQLPLTAFRFTGARYDCGSIEGLFAAGLAQSQRVASQLGDFTRGDAAAGRRIPAELVCSYATGQD